MRVTKRVLCVAIVIAVALCCGAGLVSPTGTDTVLAAPSAGKGPAAAFDTTGNVYWHFAVGTNGYLYYCNQWTGSGFGPWYNLGTRGGGLVGKPGVAFNTSGSPREVCVVGKDGKLHYTVYSGSGTLWGPWVDIPDCVFVGGVSLAFGTDGATTGRFCVGADANLWGQSTLSSWTWVNYGCPSGGLRGGPAVTFNSSGTPVQAVAVHASNDNMYGRWLSSGGWTSYGGSGGPYIDCTGAAAVTFDTYGSAKEHYMVRTALDIYGVPISAGLTHQWDYYGWGWSAWEDVGGPAKSHSGCCVTFYSSGTFPGLPRERFVIRGDGHLWGQAYNNGYWGSWTDFGVAGGGFQ